MIRLPVLWMFAAAQVALVSQPGRFLFQLVITQGLKKKKKKITDEGIEDIVDLLLTLLGGGENRVHCNSSFPQTRGI